MNEIIIFQASNLVAPGAATLSAIFGFDPGQLEGGSLWSFTVTAETSGADDKITIRPIMPGNSLTHESIDIKNSTKHINIDGVQDWQCNNVSGGDLYVVLTVREGSRLPTAKFSKS